MFHMDPTTTRVTAVRDVGPDAIALDIETPTAFEARPGQFMKVSADLNGESESRFYTISSPDVEETFELTVEVDPEGTLGPWLADREAGDELEVTGPFGTDYYEGEERAVLLAGGPGIGPAVGIAERALADGNDAAIVYRDETPIYEDRLDAVADAGAPVHVLGPDDDVTEATAEALEGGGQVFIYGFADFLDVATEAINEGGGDPETAKVENFG
jgi:3-phenylpropionate/trans-cinnamate dioxygenase ferredoxin reductase subunit